MRALAELFAINPLAQSVGLLAFGLGVLTFAQRNDQRLRVFLTVFCAVIGAHFFLLGAPAGAYAAWLSGVRSYVSMHTRHVAVMGFFLVLIWVTAVPSITKPVQWLAVIGATLGTWALYREQGIRMRARTGDSDAGDHSGGHRLLAHPQYRGRLHRRGADRKLLSAGERTHDVAAVATAGALKGP